ncbi:MAG: tetratricopeptide repeat protein [Verrucomicrobia bacterium]|nr:tetratricopeptide repeat protein [Verrucomicrobiota bacterium]
MPKLPTHLLAVITVALAFSNPATSTAVPATPPADLQLSAKNEKLATAHAHLVTARLFEESDQPREALSHYLAFIENVDADTALVAHVADLVLAYQNMDAALKLLEAQIMTHPDSPQPYVHLTLFALKHADEQASLAAIARATVKTMLLKFPRNAATYENAVALHLARGERNEATQVMATAAKQAVKDPVYWLRTGRMAQEVWPIAVVDKRTAHLQKINPFFEKARDLALAAQDQNSAIAAADYFLFSNQLTAATEICEKVVKQGGSLEARSRLVRLYEAMEKPAESQLALEDLVKVFPDSVEHRRLLASQYLQKREVEKAAQQLEAALQSGGGDLPDYLQLCNLLRFGKESDKFLHFTQRAAQLFPREPRITYFGALARSRLKQYAEAAKFYEQAATQAATKAPELLDDMFHYNHGVALERSGRYEDAARQFEKSILLTPPDDPARAAGTLNYLGYMWLERGEHLDQSEQFIRKANELEPDNPAYVDSLGWVLFKRGKLAESLTELQRAESLMKEITAEDAEILDHLAQAHDKLNQRELAEKYWRRVLDLKPDIKALIDRAQKELGLIPPRAEIKDESAQEKSAR